MSILFERVEELKKVFEETGLESDRIAYFQALRNALMVMSIDRL